MPMKAVLVSQVLAILLVFVFPCHCLFCLMLATPALATVYTVAEIPFLAGISARFCAIKPEEAESFTRTGSDTIICTMTGDNSNEHTGIYCGSLAPSREHYYLPVATARTPGRGVSYSPTHKAAGLDMRM